MAKNGKGGGKFKDLALAFGGGLVASMILEWLLVSQGKGRVSIDFSGGNDGSDPGAGNVNDLSRGYLGIAGVSGTQGYDEPTSDFQRTYNPMSASFLDAGGEADEDRPRYFQSIYDDIAQPFSRMYDPGNPQIFLQNEVNNW